MWNQACSWPIARVNSQGGGIDAQLGSAGGGPPFRHAPEDISAGGNGTERGAGSRAPAQSLHDRRADLWRGSAPDRRDRYADLRPSAGRSACRLGGGPVFRRGLRDTIGQRTSRCPVGRSKRIAGKRVAATGSGRRVTGRPKLPCLYDDALTPPIGRGAQNTRAPSPVASAAANVVAVVPVDRRAGDRAAARTENRAENLRAARCDNIAEQAADGGTDDQAGRAVRATAIIAAVLAAIDPVIGRN